MTIESVTDFEYAMHPAFFIATIIDCPVPACPIDHEDPGSHRDDAQTNKQEERNGNGCSGAYPHFLS